jgi:hypothetical protein
MMHRASPSLGLGIAVALLSACYANTDFVAVDPVMYVPPPSSVPAHEEGFGWVKTTSDRADRFRVRVGNLTYRRIIEPHKVQGGITTDAAISALASFAEEEVVRQKLCVNAKVPVEARRLIGSSTPPEMWIDVQCVR